MDCIVSNFKVKTFNKMTSKELEKEMQDFIIFNTVREIVSFTTTTVSSVGGDRIIGILIYK